MNRGKELETTVWIDRTGSTTTRGFSSSKSNKGRGWCTYSWTNRLSRFGWLVCFVALGLAIYATVLIVLALRGNLDGFDYFYSLLFAFSCVYMVFPYAATKEDLLEKVFLHRSRFWFYEFGGQAFFVFAMLHLSLSIIVVKYSTVGPRDQLLNVYTILGALSAFIALLYFYGMSGQVYAVSFAFLSFLIISSDVPIPLLGLGIAAVVITCWLLFHFLGTIAHDISYHLTVGACTAISFIFTFTQNYEDWLDIPLSDYHPVLISGVILALLRATWAYFFHMVMEGDYSDTKTEHPTLQLPFVMVSNPSTLQLGTPVSTSSSTTTKAKDP